MTDPSPDLIARAFDLVPVITGRSRQETARIIARFAQDALDAQWVAVMRSRYLARTSAWPLLTPRSNAWTEVAARDTYNAAEAEAIAEAVARERAKCDDIIAAADKVLDADASQANIEVWDTAIERLAAALAALQP